MGWNYALQWMVTLPLEIVAAAITIEYWDSPVSPALWVTIFLVLVITINLFGVEGFGEAEFYFSMVGNLVLFRLPRCKSALLKDPPMK